MRHCKGNFDIATRLKSVLIRRDVYQHLAGLFTRFQSEILVFADHKWYNNFIGTAQQVDGTEAPEGDDDDDVKLEVSAYMSKGPLLRFCTKLAKGHYELSLCKVTMLGLHFQV